MIGGLIGTRLTSLVRPDSLRKGFGWFVLLMSSVIIAQEVHLAAGVAGAVITVCAAAISNRCSGNRHCQLRRLGLGGRTGEPDENIPLGVK